MGKGRATSRTATANAVQRRPSFEIANDYVELNLVPIIEAEAEAQMSKRELRRKRRAERKAEKQRQHHYLRNGLVAATVLIAVAIATATIWWNSSTEPVNAADKNTRQFVVDRGATSDEIAMALQKAGFIRNTLAFKIYIRWHGNIIQAGTHMLSPSYGMADIVSRLAKADTDEIDIQIPPGLTLDEIKDVFKKYDYTDAEIEEALTANYNYEILADKPAGTTLEGYIYPDTYRVLAGDKLETVIDKSLTQFSTVAKQNNLAAGFAAHGLSFYQGITLASIVTKEVAKADDQKMVASVFYNRMNAGMNLGSDPTYKYAYKMGLCSFNTPEGCDSVYNTRKNEGLPPGPIANPSLTALQAVANPAESNYYYFVSGEDGKNYYSETADQHNQAVAQHCGKLCEE